MLQLFRPVTHKSVCVVVLSPECHPRKKEKGVPLPGLFDDTSSLARNIGYNKW